MNGSVKRRTRNAVLALAFNAVAISSIAAASSTGVPGTWVHLRPTNTGIQGDYAYSIAIDSSDTPWVVADDPVWAEGGLARLSGGVWSNWSNVDGRSPTDRITRVKLDPRGVPWMASDVGLLTFDGTAVQIRWSVANAPWPTNEVSDFAWDGKGNLWVALSPAANVRGGLAKYDGQSWTVYTTANGLPWPAPWDQVSAVAVDALDRIWIGSPVQGGAMFNGKKWSWLGPSGADVTAIAISPTGTPWYVFTNWGVRTWEGNKRGTWIDRTVPLGTYNVYSVTLDQAGNVWVTTYDGRIAQWNGVGWRPIYQTPNLNHVYGLAFDSVGRAWASGIGGMAVREPSGAWIVYNQENTGLPSRWINDILIDASGREWFSTADRGLSMFTGTMWTDFNRYDFGSGPWPFQTDNVYQTVQDAAGNFWSALGPQGVGELSGGSWMQSLQGYDIRSLAVDATGHLWAMPAGACYWDQVFRLDGSSWTPMGNPGGCAELYSISADSSGNIWLATNAGVMKYDGTAWTWFTTANSGLPSNFVTAVKTEASGAAVWVGTENGLARFDGTNWTTYTTANSGLPANSITALAFAPAGELWVGAFDVSNPSAGGVSRFDQFGWTTWTTANSGLPHPQVQALAVDAAGRVWIGTASEAAAVLTPSP